MALIVPLTIPAYYAEENGETVTVPEAQYPAAYARVLFVRVQSDTTYICVSWYADEASRFSGADPVRLFEYQVPTASLAGDVYPAVYAYIKTLEEFVAAVDHPFADPADDVESRDLLTATQPAGEA